MIENLLVVVADIIRVRSFVPLQTHSRHRFYRFGCKYDRAHWCGANGDDPHAKNVYAKNKSFKWEVDKINAHFVCFALCVCLIFNSFCFHFARNFCGIDSSRYRSIPCHHLHGIFLLLFKWFFAHLSSTCVFISALMSVPSTWAILNIYSDINFVHIWEFIWW